MKALVMTGYGGNEVVDLRDMPEPQVQADELLIRVHAAALNPLDFKIRNGELRLIRKFSFPAIMGNDLAGVVIATGPEVSKFKVGDEIFARVAKDRLGAFAEFAVVEEGYAAHKPKTLTMEEAAGVPLAGLTAWQALHDELKLGPGKKVFIPAGAGGVGSFAIQFAKIFGATVATTTSTAGRDLVAKLGADVIIDYKTQRFEALLRDYDAVFDTMGGESLRRSFDILRPGGEICSIAGVPEPGTADRLGSNWAIKAIFYVLSAKLRRQARARNARYVYLFMRPDGAQLREIANLIDAGRVRTHVDRAFPLTHGKEALSYVETGRAKGKVILKIR